jgi:uncharacterized protein YbcV (DUF1398 family)
MDITDLAESLKNKEDFIFFLQELQKHFLTHQDEWENTQLDRYFEAMEAFLNSSTEKSLNKIDFTPSWSLFAQIMLAASIYE